MTGRVNPKSKTHDLFTVILGGFAAGVLISSPWQVDTSGPYPFYKGALIFPLMALSLMVVAAIPAAVRMIRPPEEAVWKLDGGGKPIKPLVALCLLIAFLAGLPLIGLEVSAFLFLGVILYILGHRTPKVFLGIPVILTITVYVVFKYLLDVYFPTPLLFEFFGG